MASVRMIGRIEGHPNWMAFDPHTCGNYGFFSAFGAPACVTLSFFAFASCINGLDVQNSALQEAEVNTH